MLEVLLPIVLKYIKHQFIEKQSFSQKRIRMRKKKISLLAIDKKIVFL